MTRGSIRLIGVALGFGLVGCATRTPPHLWPDPVPPHPSPTPVEWTPALDACPRSEPLLPGQPAPYVVDGRATCRAVILPEARLAQLLEAEADAQLWRGVAGVCQDGRERDRRHAQVAFDGAWIVATDSSAQLRAARLSAVIGVVATAGVCAIAR